MSTPRKLLVIGLLSPPPQSSQFGDVNPLQLKETVQEEFRKIKEAGFDVDVSLCDDRHFDKALMVSLPQSDLCRNS